MKKRYYVYILTNKINTVLYIGVTSNLIRRMNEHRQGLLEGFSKRYNTKKLVYYEIIDDVLTALNREKQLKNWHKDWKWNLIKENNPNLIDLCESIN